MHSEAQVPAAAASLVSDTLPLVSRPISAEETEYMKTVRRGLRGSEYREQALMFNVRNTAYWKPTKDKVLCSLVEEKFVNNIHKNH